MREKIKKTYEYACVERKIIKFGLYYKRIPYYLL